MKNIDLLDVARRINNLLEHEDRKDIEMRMNILLSQLGPLASYVTHDQTLNPNARSYGSPKEEKLSYGQAFVQLVACANLRKVDIVESVEAALRNWELRDWRKSFAADPNEVSGMVAHEGRKIGNAFLYTEERSLDDIKEKEILIAQSLGPDITPYLGKLSGIVTDHGGLTSHAAILSREYEIPCIVGTGNATQRIKHGQEIELCANDKIGYVKTLISDDME